MTPRGLMFIAILGLGSVTGKVDGQNPERFRTADRCIACHKGVVTTEGLDVSIGYDWRASMMANSARDPYWQASVRREIVDFPEAAQAIEEKCSRCHMPMASVSGVFEHLPIGREDEGNAALAADGVSCSACHQISPERLGTEASFTGGFHVQQEAPAEGRAMYGPFEPDPGGVGIMHSATEFRPTEGAHVRSSELCATCHTLITHAITPDGSEGPEFPEQAPYLEWQASAFAREGASCQDCHMPVVAEPVPVTDVLGRARPEVSRHVFRGGNFFMLRMLNRYRNELGVSAPRQEFALSAERTESHLREATAKVTVENAAVDSGRLSADIRVENYAGHKFPTAYPSRRAWLHVWVTDAGGGRVFESGAFAPDGHIVGSDSDEDGTLYEPHYTEINNPEQVQIYEAVMVDGDNRITTGLMSAHRWIKDNRLWPVGFDALNADPRVSVFGRAGDDTNFGEGSDRIRYAIEVTPGAGPFKVAVELWFQPVAYRWAMNLGEYQTFETQRFIRYYREMAASSAIVIGRDSLSVP